jgi:hypothetical protein
VPGTQIVTLGPIVATGVGAAAPIYQLDNREAGITCWGTFVGTATVEVSPDGANWTTAKNAAGTAIGNLTAPAIHILGGQWGFIRYNCSAWTSGTIYITVTAYNPA